MTPDVVDLLLGQHARVEELFREVQAATGTARRDTFYDLVRLLSVHETAEEMLVHPLARRTIDSGDALVEDRLAEERDAKELLRALVERGPDDPAFPPMLLELRDAVLTHATYEERYEFTRLREANSRATLIAIAPAVLAAEAVAPTRPHPGVESATLNTLLGPFVAASDRIKDAIRTELEKAEAAAPANR
jgi:hemerythrin superfamily protein